jgi:hypothetical protein
VEFAAPDTLHFSTNALRQLKSLATTNAFVASKSTDKKPGAKSNFSDCCICTCCSLCFYTCRS